MLKVMPCNRNHGRLKVHQTVMDKDKEFYANNQILLPLVCRCKAVIFTKPVLHICNMEIK